MSNRWLGGSLLVLLGLALTLGGIWISLAREWTRISRLVWLGIIISGLGVWILVRGTPLAPDPPSDRHEGARFGLYALAVMSLAGSVFLTVYAIRTPGYRGLSLLIAAGILIVGIGSLFLVRRLRG